jgi:K+ transporter
MALDRWFPARFANLSDRFVTQNGVLLMGAAALVMLLITRGSVGLLVVLYSINVFITFSLSQLGMVRHWWHERRTEHAWKRKLAINGFGLLLTTFILISLTVVKFHEGGWATLLVTGALVAAAFGIKRHYTRVGSQLQKLDSLIHTVQPGANTAGPTSLDPAARTAVVLVNGYNGLGVHTLLNVPRMFGDTFKNYIFVQVGLVDAGNFKGAADLAALRTHIDESARRYVAFAQARGYGAEAVTEISTDAVAEIERLCQGLRERLTTPVFFAGQLLFERETRFSRWLHNHTVFILQRRFFLANLPFVILPIRVAG